MSGKMLIPRTYTIPLQELRAKFNIHGDITQITQEYETLIIKTQDEVNV